MQDSTYVYVVKLICTVNWLTICLAMKSALITTWGENLDSDHVLPEYPRYMHADAARIRIRSVFLKFSSISLFESLAGSGSGGNLNIPGRKSARTRIR